MIGTASNNVRMTTHPSFFSTNIAGVNISGRGDISHSRSSEPQMHFSTGRDMVYMVEFTPTAHSVVVPRRRGIFFVVLRESKDLLCLKQDDVLATGEIKLIFRYLYISETYLSTSRWRWWWCLLGLPPSWGWSNGSVIGSRTSFLPRVQVGPKLEVVDVLWT